MLNQKGTTPTEQKLEIYLTISGEGSKDDVATIIEFISNLLFNYANGDKEILGTHNVTSENAVVSVTISKKD